MSNGTTFACLLVPAPGDGKLTTNNIVLICLAIAAGFLSMLVQHLSVKNYRRDSRKAALDLVKDFFTFYKDGQVFCTHFVEEAVEIFEKSIKFKSFLEYIVQLTPLSYRFFDQQGDAVNCLCATWNCRKGYCGCFTDDWYEYPLYGCCHRKCIDPGKKHCYCCFGPKSGSRSKMGCRFFGCNCCTGCTCEDFNEDQPYGRGCKCCGYACCKCRLSEEEEGEDETDEEDEEDEDEEDEEIKDKKQQSSFFKGVYRLLKKLEGKTDYYEVSKFVKTIRTTIGKMEVPDGRIDRSGQPPRGERDDQSSSTDLTTTRITHQFKEPEGPRETRQLPPNLRPGLVRTLKRSHSAVTVPPEDTTGGDQSSIYVQPSRPQRIGRAMSRSNFSLVNVNTHARHHSFYNPGSDEDLAVQSHNTNANGRIPPANSDLRALRNNLSIANQSRYLHDNVPQMM